MSSVLVLQVKCWRIVVHSVVAVTCRMGAACIISIVLLLLMTAETTLSSDWTDLQSWVSSHSPGDYTTNNELADLDGNDWTESKGNAGGSFLWSNNPESISSGDVNKGLAYMTVTPSCTVPFSVALHHMNDSGACAVIQSRH